MSATKIIKQILKEKNMSQTELAATIGTTRQNLANKMSRDNFSTAELLAISKVLNCNIILKDAEGKEYIIEE